VLCHDLIVKRFCPRLCRNNPQWHPLQRQRKVYISRLHGGVIGGAERLVLRRTNRFTAITDESCRDVSKYRRNFAALLHA
jgi:hypothetical protein